ncbi:hypothetical protein PDJAM_G00118320 [Pangasius djambal]|uniref:Uncharacterized protein n=1 Tax=Pangasius djambal TaxID=1691987 RepID=A0ACC5Z9F5_9TELE|nr:hypothetical protein [Pangasius djambal]
MRCEIEDGSPVLLREEVTQLQEEVHLLRQMKEMLNKDLQETQGCSANALSATELRIRLAEKERELDRAKEALQAMKCDRTRLKAEKADLVNQMQQLYTTLESREEQLRDFIRNYDQHRKESEDAVKSLAKEKDLLEREKWDLRRQTKEATEHAGLLRSQIDLKENRIKELEAELTMIILFAGARPCLFLTTIAIKPCVWIPNSVVLTLHVTESTATPGSSGFLSIPGQSWTQSANYCTFGKETYPLRNTFSNSQRQAPAAAELDPSWPPAGPLIMVATPVFSAPSCSVIPNPEPRPKMAANPEPRPKMAANPEPRPKMAANPEPRPKMAASPEPLHKMSVTPEI